MQQYWHINYLFHLSRVLVTLSFTIIIGCESRTDDLAQIMKQCNPFGPTAVRKRKTKSQPHGITPYGIRIEQVNETSAISALPIAAHVTDNPTITLPLESVHERSSFTVDTDALAAPLFKERRSTFLAYYKTQHTHHNFLSPLLTERLYMFLKHTPNAQEIIEQKLHSINKNAATIETFMIIWKKALTTLTHEAYYTSSAAARICCWLLFPDKLRCYTSVAAINTECSDHELPMPLIYCWTTGT